MDEGALRREIESVGRRARRANFLRRLALSGPFCVALAFALSMACQERWISPSVAMTSVIGIGAFLIGWAWRRSALAANERTLVASVESAFPELAGRLATALDASNADATCPLRRRLLRETLEHAGRRPWTSAVAFERWRAAVAGISLTIVIALLANLRDRPAASPQAPVVAASPIATPTIEPGDAVVEGGDDFLVTARFEPSATPDDVVLRRLGEDGADSEARFAMTPAPGVLAVRVADVRAPFRYRVEFPGGSSATYIVQTRWAPALLESDVTLHFPAFVGRPDERLADVRRVTAVEGAEVTLHCRFNQPIASATLAGDSGELRLPRDANDPTRGSARFPMVESRTYRLCVVAKDGESRGVAELRFDVVPNRRPVVTMPWPGRDVVATPIEELTLEANAVDDFGVWDCGLTLFIAGEPPKSMTIVNAGGAVERSVSYILRLEELGARPDQSIAYSFWAEDVGCDGRRRRTHGPIRHIAIQPFEQIYRSAPQDGGESTPGGGRGGAAVAALLELQRQAIGATWRLMTQAEETIDPKQFVSDIGAPLAAERQAFEQSAALETTLEGEKKSEAGAIRAAIGEAVDRLAEAESLRAPAPLAGALAAEQRAYEGLLRLREREHSIGRPGAGGVGAGDPSDRQLQAIDAPLARDRYETQRRAGRHADERQRADWLRRLKELADRQERLADETGQCAGPAPTSAESERRLRRLRDDQQQLLRDLDELRGEMAAAHPTAEAASAAQSLEAARREAAVGARALRDGRLSQALGASVRASDRLRAVGDALQNSTGERLRIAATELREQSATLANEQRDIQKSIERLQPAPGEGRPALASRRSLIGRVAGQREGLQSLLGELEQVARMAESADPSLHRQLYDALRQAQQRALPTSNERTRALLEAGMLGEAAAAQGPVVAEVDELAQSLAQAANARAGDATNPAPIDADPPPARFEAVVRRYFESLGSMRR